MNKEKTLGQFRELLSAGGMLVFGASNDQTSAIIGLIVAIAALVWSIQHYEGGEVIFTMLRKALGAVPGVLVALSVIDLEKATALAAFLPLLVAMVWSFVSKGGQLPPIKDKVGLVLVSMLAICLTSCSTLSRPPEPQTINAILDVAKIVVEHYK